MILEFLFLQSSLYLVQVSVMSNRGQRPGSDSETDAQEGRILLIVFPAALVILCQSDTLRKLH